MEGEMNMLLWLYKLLTGSLVSVLRVQVLFLNIYALLLRRRCALDSVCLNYEILFKPYNERRFWVTASWWDSLYMPILNSICKKKIKFLMFVFFKFLTGTGTPTFPYTLPAAVICAFTQVRLLWKYGFMSLPAILRLKWAQSC